MRKDKGSGYFPLKTDLDLVKPRGLDGITMIASYINFHIKLQNSIIAMTMIAIMGMACLAITDLLEKNHWTLGLRLEEEAFYLGGIIAGICVTAIGLVGLAITCLCFAYKELVYYKGMREE